jgi:hypothetical protein
VINNIYFVCKHESSKVVGHELFLKSSYRLYNLGKVSSFFSLPFEQCFYLYKKNTKVGQVLVNIRTQDPHLSEYIQKKDEQNP